MTTPTKHRPIKPGPYFYRLTHLEDCAGWVSYSGIYLVFCRPTGHWLACDTNGQGDTYKITAKQVWRILCNRPRASWDPM